MKNILFLLLLCFSPFSNAQILLQHSDVWFLIVPAHHNRILVYRNQNQKVDQLKIVDQSGGLWSNDHSTDLTFEGDDRLVIKDFGTTVTATYMTETKAPIKLNQVALNSERLDQLGFDSFLKLETQSQTESQGSVASSDPNTHFSIFELRPSRYSDADIQLEHRLSNIGFKAHHFLGPLSLRGDRYPLFMFVSEDEENRIRQELGESVLVHRLDLTSQATTLTFEKSFWDFTQLDSSLRERLKSLSSIVHNLNAVRSLNFKDKNLLFLSVKEFLYDLDRLNILISKKPIGADQKNRWRKSFTKLAQDAFKILDGLDINKADRFVLDHPELVNGAGFELFFKDLDSKSLSLFSKWILQQSANLKCIERDRLLPDFKVFMQNSGAPLGDLTSVVKSNQSWSMQPAVVFGVGLDRDREIKEVIEFVLLADKSAVEFSAWFKRHSPLVDARTVHGDVVRFLIELAKPDQNLLNTAEGFNIENYVIHIMEIYYQLLETSRVSMKHPEVYRALLLGIQEITKLAEKLIAQDKVGSPLFFRTFSKLQSEFGQKLFKSILDFQITNQADRDVCLGLLHPEPLHFRLGNLSLKN